MDAKQENQRILAEILNRIETLSRLGELAENQSLFIDRNSISAVRRIHEKQGLSREQFRSHVTKLIQDERTFETAPSALEHVLKLCQVYEIVELVNTRESTTNELPIVEFSSAYNSLALIRQCVSNDSYLHDLQTELVKLRSNNSDLTLEKQLEILHLCMLVTFAAAELGKSEEFVTSKEVLVQWASDSAQESARRLFASPEALGLISRFLPNGVELPTLEAVLGSDVTIAKLTPIKPTRVYYPITSASRFPTARPFTNIARALADANKRNWKENAGENTIDYSPTGKEGIIPYYKHSNSDIAPPEVYSDPEALASWFGLTRKRVDELGPRELQIFLAMQHHYTEARQTNPATAWAYIDLTTIAKYLGADSNSWNQSNRATWGSALDRILKLHVRGEWLDYCKGRNADRAQYRVNGPVIHAKVLEERPCEDRKGQASLMARFPVAIEYNLGPDYERYLTLGKTQETRLVPALLKRDAAKEGDIIRLGHFYLTSFRMHDRDKQTGVIYGMAIREHLEQAGVVIPEWVYSKWDYAKFAGMVLKWIQEAAKDVGAKPVYCDESGKDTDTPYFGLKGAAGFEQFLSRVCRIIPNQRDASGFVKALEANRAKRTGKATKSKRSRT